MKQKWSKTEAITLNSFQLYKSASKRRASFLYTKLKVFQAENYSHGTFIVQTAYVDLPWCRNILCITKTKQNEYKEISYEISEKSWKTIMRSVSNREQKLEWNENRLIIST